ncbi:MAG: ABC transporter substrate-binding protein [Nitrososphaerales archaeon]
MKVLQTTSRCALLILSLLFLLTCHPPPQERERTVIDDLGQQVKIKKDIKSIVSLVPTNSELVCLLDCERLKGGTRYDLFPEELVRRIKDKKIRIIGGGFDPNLELIVEIGPDLILANGPSQQKAVLPLKRLGYPVLSLYAQNIEWLKKDFLLLGEILDRKARARTILKGVDRGLREMQKKTAQKKRKRVYLQTWPNPMITVGKGSFSQSLLTLAGGINVFEDMPFDSGKVSIEWIIKRNPEVMIFTNHQLDFVNHIVKRPEWREIDAVKNNHICLIHEANLRRRVQFLDGVNNIYRCLFEKHTNEQIFRLDSGSGS